MKGLILIELISLVSFIFSLLTFVVQKATISNFMIIFLWTLLVSYLLVSLKNKNRKYLYIGILMFLPVIRYHTILDIIFLSVTAIYIYYYIFQYFGEVGFNFIKGDFQKKLIFFLVIILLSFILKGTYMTRLRYTTFMIIYFISTIIFLRSLRHLEYDSDIKRLNKSNLNYVLFITIFSLIFSMDKLKNVLFMGIKNLYILVVNIIFKILYWPMVYLVNLVNYLIEFIINLQAENMTRPLDEGANEILDFSKLVQEDPSLPSWLVSLISVVSKLAIIIFIIFLVKRLFRKKVFNRRKEGKAYIEEREFISLNNKGKNRILIFKPKGVKEQIRYYYKKYMIKAKKKGIGIEDWNTSLDINIKAEKVFNKEGIDRLRHIYIETRYSKEEVSQSRAQEMKRLYKRI